MLTDVKFECPKMSSLPELKQDLRYAFFSLDLIEVEANREVHIEKCNNQPNSSPLFMIIVQILFLVMTTELSYSATDIH